MAWDPVRQRTVVFGGFDTAGHPLSDTWEWDGSDWVEKHPSLSPPGRSQHATAFDAARGRIIVFGGWNGTAALADLWEWDGTNWVERLPPIAPPPHRTPILAWDAARQRLVLAGAGAIWEWDGTSWSGGTPAPGSSGQAYQGVRGMTWDPVRGRTVATIWVGFNFDCETWEWDGTSWTQLPADLRGPLGGSLWWDADRGQTMAFNGVLWALER